VLACCWIMFGAPTCWAVGCSSVDHFCLLNLIVVRNFVWSTDAGWAQGDLGQFRSNWLSSVGLSVCFLRLGLFRQGMWNAIQMNTAETWKSLILILEHEPCDIIYLFIILVLVMYLVDFMTSKFSDEHSCAYRDSSS
jgi:hypothetical protein